MISSRRRATARSSADRSARTITISWWRGSRRKGSPSKPTIGIWTSENTGLSCTQASASAWSEEFKHFGMDLEFLLRRTPKWRVVLKDILFKEGDIVEHGEEAEDDSG